MRLNLYIYTRAALTAGLAACVVVSVGCASGTLRDGIWRLRYQARVTQTQLPFPIDDVELALQTGFDEMGNEIIELQPLDADLSPAYGDVREEGDQRIVRIEHLESGWNFRMFGVVQTPEVIVGTRFLAKARQIEDMSVDGRWDMRWLRDVGE